MSFRFYPFVFACFVLFSGYVHADTAPLGTFKGNLRLEQAPNTERVFRVLEDFEFVGPNKRRWVVPRQTEVDGASIPQVLWSLIGGPWEGRYSFASVIHDHFCETKSRPWRDVHRVFYDAMLANGVGRVRALMMYAAVYRFGPRWSNEKQNFRVCVKHLTEKREVSIDDINGMCAIPYWSSAIVTWTPPASEKDWAALQNLAEGGGTPSDIEALSEKQLRDQYTPAHKKMGLVGND